MVFSLSLARTLARLADRSHIESVVYDSIAVVIDPVAALPNVGVNGRIKIGAIAAARRVTVPVPVIAFIGLPVAVVVFSVADFHSLARPHDCLANRRSTRTIHNTSAARTRQAGTARLNTGYAFYGFRVPGKTGGAGFLDLRPQNKSEKKN
jgi:hypothetical protein